MAYRIESDDQDQEIRDLMNRVSELENQLASAQKPDASENTLPIHGVSVSFDDEIDAELERRSIVQYNDDDDDEPHWDEGKLYWARKMFREGAKWANER